jgi:predicted transposase/invertase (TIGR01784 family)
MNIGGKYINPFTDFGFKLLFGEEPNKDLLIDFLNELLKEEQGTITELTYLKNEQVGRTEFDRRAIFDLYCKNERGEYFIVEMQKAKQKFFKDRSLFYATFPIRDQALQGDWNFQLKKVYMIGILDFIFEDEAVNSYKFRHTVKLKETETNHVFLDKLTFIFLEMPKFNKKEPDLDTHFDKWLFILKNLSHLERMPLRMQEKIFEKLFTVAEIAKFSPEQQTAYEDSLKVYLDLKNVMDTAKEEAFEEGKVEGEKKRNLEIAKIMKKSGESIEKISLFTGLTAEEINSLSEHDF